MKKKMSSKNRFQNLGDDSESHSDWLNVNIENQIL